MTSPIPSRQPGGQAVNPSTSVTPVQATLAESQYVYDSREDGLEGGGLLEYWHIVRSHLGLLIVCAFVGGLLAVLYTIPQTPVYRASTTVEIQILNPDFMKMSQVNMYDDSSQSWDNKDIQTQIEVMQSEALLSRVVAKLDRPAEDYALETGRLSAWRRALNLPAPVAADPHAEALDLAASSLRVTTRGDTRIVEISAESTSPTVAADFVNTLGEEYVQQNLESRWDMSQRTGDWLQRQLEDMRIKLEQSEEELQAYARKSGLLYTSESGSVAEDKLRQLQHTLSSVQADRVAKQSRYEMVTTSPPEALPDVLADSSLRAYLTKLTDLATEKAELATTFTPEHAKVRRVDAQIVAVQSALENERGAIVKRIQNEYEESLRRERLLSRDYEAQATIVNDESAKSVQYNILRREVDSIRELYETMLERVKSSSIASALRASNVRVVDPAQPSTAPIGKNLPRTAMVGLMLGGFLGVVFVITRDRMDQSVKNPGDLSYYSNLRELGTIPAAKRPGKVRIVYRPKKKHPGAAPPKALTRVSPALPRCLETITARGKPSLVAESFRAAVTSILFSAEGGERPTVLTVTSAYPDEGKTTVTSNLAIALAEVNQKVLLIDADLRRPRMHEVFAVENSHGLADLLLEAGSVDDASLKGAIHQTVVQNLFLLPGGDPVLDPTQLLHSSRMAPLLEMAEKDFDTVLIDTPPMMQMPDARVVGRMSHAVILVARAGRTNRETALVASQRFAEDGTRVLGSILNCWNPSGSGQDGPYARYYQYYASRV